MHWFRRLNKKGKPAVVSYNNIVYDENYIKDFVIHWSITYPIDRWWRERHKIAFNSAAHRDVSFLDMRFEFDEYVMNNKIIEQQQYKPDTGEFLIDEVSPLISEEERAKEFAKEFENLDLTQFDG